MSERIKTELSDGICAGRYVLSLAGRDAGRIHVVLSTDGQHAYISDGKTRTVGKPKKKKYRHLKLLDAPLYNGERSNSAIAKAIASAETVFPNK